jgi:DNA polymerase-3 subunit gamma/tau
MQILDQTLSRMRYSAQGRILAELAIVRICSLENLDDLARLVEELRSGSPGSSVAATKRPPANASTPTDNPQRADSPPTPTHNGIPDATDLLESPSNEPVLAAVPEIELNEANATEIWSRALSQLDGMAADPAKQFAHVRLSEPNKILVTFKAGNAFNKTICEQPDNLAEFDKALARVVGRRVRVSFEVEDGPAIPREKKPAAKVVSPQQRLMDITKHPMIRRAGKLFGATPTEVIDPPNKS